jgi:hypothetical protein
VNIFTITGCGGGGGGTVGVSPLPPDVADGAAPTATSDLYFIPWQNVGSTTYFAWVGLEGFRLDRTDAQWLGSSPGYQFYNNHMGGIGNTLEVVSYSNGIYMQWAYNMLWTLSLFNGWQGQIMTRNDQPTSIRLSSTAIDFLDKFPTAKSDQPNDYSGKSYCIVTPESSSGYASSFRLIADCDASGVIKRIRADSYSSSTLFLNSPGPK